jgi:hypothetical protein
MTDIDKSVPLYVSLDVAPGYRNGVHLKLDDMPIDLRIQRTKSSPSQKWNTTFYLSYYTALSDMQYYVNLSLDRELQKMYGRTRLTDVKAQKELSNFTYKKLFDPSHEFSLRGELQGNVLSVYLDGELMDTEVLPFEPTHVELGASSGRFNVSLISPPPPPAPE